MPEELVLYVLNKWLQLWRIVYKKKKNSKKILNGFIRILFQYMV